MTADNTECGCHWFTMDSMWGNGEVSDLPKNKVCSIHISLSNVVVSQVACASAGYYFSETGQHSLHVVSAHLHNNRMGPSNSIQISEACPCPWALNHWASCSFRDPPLLAALPCMRTFKYLSWFKYAEKKLVWNHHFEISLGNKWDPVSKVWGGSKARLQPTLPQPQQISITVLFLFLPAPLLLGHFA